MANSGSNVRLCGRFKVIGCTPQSAITQSGSSYSGSRVAQGTAYPSEKDIPGPLVRRTFDGLVDVEQQFGEVIMPVGLADAGGLDPWGQSRFDRTDF